MTPFHPLEIIDVRRETEEAISVAFRVPEALREAYVYYPGQHLTLKARVDGEELRRSYSICSSLKEQNLRVVIKQIEGGTFSTFANRMFQKGQIVDVMVPQGRFFTRLMPDHKKRYLFVAAGSGITPIYSLLKSVLEEEPESSVTLVYGNRRASSVVFLEALEDLKNQYAERVNLIYIMSREPQDIPLFNGRIDRAKCAELFSGPLAGEPFDEVFLCGPEQVITEVRDYLLEEGMAPARIHFELFVTDTVREAAARAPEDIHKFDTGPERQVTVILDGRRTDVGIPAEGVSILDAALEAGVDLPYACKGGVCCTCRAKVVEGDVRMDVNYALDDDEVEDGYVLTCQSHPLSDGVVVDFDA
ncbi:1,2-phenylacetyl-CoA epoxidase subunit PaaE [Sneathiella chinensis]|uniref:Phenylacetic acid degradation NADH oxidoreductase PaaE n=1 Tax=Sneathiella chinensis TaxID=349750 RepID=A0ABQ5U5R5_9PROT|nr:1,2-phenylacetyl-CoA epoxidase subunit PaaE [Sneathiella chinensis]GLQ06657.1 phenylacetic acid degradation NADH oxidoreductase PaaE [Sneathiella chinensis]